MSSATKIATASRPSEQDEFDTLTKSSTIHPPARGREFWRALRNCKSRICFNQAISVDEAFQLGQSQTVQNVRTAIPLLIADVVAVCGSIGFASFVEVVCWRPVFGDASIGCRLLAFVWSLQAFNGLYPACGMSHDQEFGRCLRTVFLVSLVLAGVALIAASRSSLSWLGLCEFHRRVVTISVCLFRPVAEAGIEKSRVGGAQPVLIIGSQAKAKRLHDRSRADGEAKGLRPLGVLVVGDQSWSEGEGTGWSNANFLSVRSIVSAKSWLGSGTCRLALADNLGGSLRLEQLRGVPNVSLPTGQSHPVDRARLSQCADGSAVQFDSGHCLSSVVSAKAFDGPAVGHCLRPRCGCRWCC